MGHLQEQARRGQATNQAVADFAKLAQRFLGPGPEQAGLLQAAGQVRIQDIQGKRRLSPENEALFQRAFPELFKTEEPITRRGAEFGLQLGGILQRRRAATRQERSGDQQLLSTLTSSRDRLFADLNRVEAGGSSLFFGGSKEQQRKFLRDQVNENARLRQIVLRRLFPGGKKPADDEPALPPEVTPGFTRTKTGGKPRVTVKVKRTQ